MITFLTVGIVLLVLRVLGVRIWKRSLSKQKEMNFMASGDIFEINEKEFELKLKRENGDILDISFITCKEWFLNRKFKLNERISVPCHSTIATL